MNPTTPAGAGTGILRAAALEIALAGISDFVYAFDRAGRFVYANEALLQLWGCSLNDALGKSFLELGYPPELARRLDEQVASVFATGEPLSDETAYTSPAGLTGRYEYIFRPVRGADQSVTNVVGSTRDITARHQVSEALAGSEAKFRQLANSIPQLAWMADAEGWIYWYNERWFEFTGSTLSEMQGWGWQRVHDPTELPQVLARWSEALAQGKPLDMIFPLRRADGVFRRFLTRVMPLRDASGTIQTWFGTNTDITEQEEARLGVEKLAERLRTSEERLRRVAEASGVILWEWNSKTGQIESDAGFASLFGLPEGTELTISAVASRIDPDHHSMLAEAAAKAMRGESEGRHVVEFRTSGLDGSPDRWVESRGRPLSDPDGRTAGLAGAMIEITARRQAEEAQAELLAALTRSEAQFRQLADAMPQIVWAAQPDGSLDYYNQRWYEYIGLPNGSMEEAAWDRFLHPEDLPATYQQWQESLQSGKPYSREFRVRGENQEYHWYLTRALPIRDLDGTITRWFGTCTDIQNQKELQAEKEQLLASERAARSTAEHASRMKDEFLATLSHELRTPLNAIFGWTQLLKDGQSDPGLVAEAVDVIDRNVRAQAQLIEDLLDMSRIISGKLRLDVRSIQPEASIEAAIETVRPAAEAKGVRLERILDPLAGPISGDSARLQQVVWNLLSNAIKFTPRGGKVQVVLERINSHLELSVSDTGVGISAEFLPHVFDRFRQADSASNRRHGGLGLGLAIVQQLVELHGGTVAVESLGLDLGASFIVSLPLKAASQRSNDDRPHPAVPETRGFDLPHAALAGLRLVIVDDERDARELLRRLLEERGCTVYLASTAGEAIALIRSVRPDVLISDIGMADVDGYELIRRVRSLPSEDGGLTPAVALTAFARSEDRTRALLAGFQAHIAKPVEPTELLAMIASAAGRV